MEKDALSQEKNTIFQSFRVPHHPDIVRIPAVKHPSLGEYYIIWTDICNCFPGVVRIQHNDNYVSFMRDRNLYRVRPHGIIYHPGVVLDVIYENNDPEFLAQNSSKKSRHSPKNKSVVGSGVMSRTRGKEDEINSTQSTSTSNLTSLQSRYRRLARMDKEIHSNRVLDDYMTASIERIESSSADEIEDDHRNREEFDRDTDEEGSADGNQFGYLEDDNAATKSTKPKYLTGNTVSTNSAPVDRGFMKAINALHRVEVRAKSALDIVDTVESEASVYNSASKDDTAISTREEDSMKASHGSVDYDGDEERMLKKIEGLDGIAKMRDTIHEYLGEESYSTCSDDSLDQNEFTIRNLVRKRASLILKQEYSWIEAENPKLFIILPNNYEAFGDPDYQVDDVYIKSLKWTDFSLHVLCDCGNIPGYESINYPHLNVKNCPEGHTISDRTEDSILKKFGFYLLAILEAFKYGLHIKGEEGEDDIIVPAVTDTGLWKAMSASINFLSYQNFFGSELMWMMSGKEKDLAEISAVDPLSKEDLVSLGVLLSESRWAHPDVRPVLIPSGRVRWVCEQHCDAVSPHEEVTKARIFSSNPASLLSDYMPSMSAFRSVIKTPERARDFYQLAPKLTTTCIIRLFLDWDLTSDDIRELCQAVSKFPTAFVKIQVQSSSGNGGTIPGFEHALPEVIFEALNNPRIKAFILYQGGYEERGASGTRKYNEWQEIQQEPEMVGSLAHFKKDKVTDRIDLRLFVSNVDHAVVATRRVVKGLHRFSNLALIHSDSCDHIFIRFINLSDAGFDIIDTDYESDDFLEFFEKRGNLDSVMYKLGHSSYSRFIKSKVLRGVTIGYNHSKDRTKIRDVLKNNKRLLAISLDNPIADDPCQIYEYHKNLISTHASLGRLDIVQRHDDNVSEIVWNAVNNPQKMSISVTTHAGDKVGQLFQKYGNSIKFLCIYSISSSDAALLDSALGPKKGPIRLEKIVAYNLHNFDPAALESLRRIVVRWDQLRVEVHESVLSTDSRIKAHGNLIAQGGGGRGKNKTKQSEKARKVEQDAIAKGMVKTAEFIYSAAPRMTCFIAVFSPFRILLEELGARGLRASILPSLTVLMLSGSGKKLLEYEWIKGLLYLKSMQFRNYLKTRSSKTTVRVDNDTASSSATTTPEEPKESQEQGTGKLGTENNKMTRLVSNLEAEKVEPIRELSLTDFQFKDDDINYFLEYANFSEMVSCHLEITNEISGETLMRIANALPADNRLESIMISAPGPSHEDSLRCHKLIKQKCDKSRYNKQCIVHVNGLVA